MDKKTSKLLDDVGWKLLRELQRDARLSYTELGQRVGLSSPAVTERIHKMEEAGIITGYHTRINFEKVGLPVMAIVHIKALGWQRTQARMAQIEQIPEVVELYRSTGDDSMYVKVISSSVDELTRIVCQLSKFGTPSMTIVNEDPLVH
ncbi:MAG: Lrp/AsnC family transcriptional regulator [Chloroflexota bacterium]